MSGFSHGRGPLSPSIFITLAPYVCICKLSRQAVFHPPTPTIPSSAQGVFLDVCKGRLLRTSRPFSVFKKIIIYPPPHPKKTPPKKNLSIGRLLGRLAGYVQDCVKTGRTQGLPKNILGGLKLPFPKILFLVTCVHPVLTEYITSKDVHRSSKNI